MLGATAWARKKPPSTLTAMTRRQSSSPYSRDRRTPRDAGVVDEDVDPAEPRERLVDHALPIFGGRDVSGDGDDLGGETRRAGGLGEWLGPPPP